MKNQSPAYNLDQGSILSEEKEQLYRAPARLLEYAPDRYIALPTHTTLEIVEDPEIYPVPGAALYGLGLLYWQEHWLAVVDLARMFLQNGLPDVSIATEKPRYVLVLAYQRMPGYALEYGAITLPVLPETIFIGDDAACDLPTDSPIWATVSLSCFTYAGHTIPVLNTAQIFGRSHQSKLSM